MGALPLIGFKTFANTLSAFGRLDTSYKYSKLKVMHMTEVRNCESFLKVSVVYP